MKASAEAAFTEYLTQHHLRRTPERYTILEKVMDTASHFSIEWLCTDLEADGYHVSRATVYNTIELLIKCGLVRRHSFNSQSPQYEKVVGMARHYHLVCSSCGKVREIKDTDIDALLAIKRFGKFQPAYIDMNIYGLCGSCARKAKQANNKSTKNKPTTHKKHSN